MPLKDYGVLVGRVADRRAEGGTDTPHYQIRVSGGGVDYRVAVNVLSQQAPPDLLFVSDEALAHPILAGLPSLPEGFTNLPSAPGGLALDFIRANLLDRAAMRPVPPTAPGPDNDLADKLDHFVGRAQSDPGSRIYAFGQRFGPEPTTPDKIFGFLPGNGVHDIHMNQGNSGAFRRDNGVWQDGGLILHFPGRDQSPDQWVSVFLAFQSQSWHTDDTTGDPQVPPGPIPGDEEPDARVRIVGALVNGVGGGRERESVTLLNASDADVVLGGWAILDRQKRRFPLPGDTLPAGEARRFPLDAPVELGNSGGLITLLDAQGLKVDGLAYTGEQVQREGWTLVP